MMEEKKSIKEKRTKNQKTRHKEEKDTRFKCLKL
jgi:hypothetical protein